MSYGKFEPSDFSGRPLRDPNSPSNPIYLSDAGALPSWNDSPEAWDTVIFNGTEVPGICRVGGKAYELRKDHKKAQGTQGAAITTLGREAAEPEFRLLLWKDEHLERFQAIIKAFIPQPKAKNLPGVRVVHPALAIYGIRKVILFSASFPDEKDPGVWEVHLKTVEDRRGKDKTKTNVEARVTAPNAIQEKIQGNGARSSALLGPIDNQRNTENQSFVNPLARAPAPTPFQTNGNAPRPRSFKDYSL